MSQSFLSRQAALSLQVPTLKPRLGSARLAWPLSVPTLRLRQTGRLKRTTTGGGVCPREVTMAALPGLFPHPDSALLYVMEFFFAASGPLQTYNEATGKNMSYSKFAGLDGRKRAMIPSKRGFFLFYFPAAVVAGVFLAYGLRILPLGSVLESVGASGVASFLQQAVASSDDRLLLVAAALWIHLLKRCLEVLFVHKFSGSVSVGDTVVITQSYTSQACLLLYSQMLSAGFEAPSPDLKWLGVAVFLIGITGNAYHHWILAQLRKDGNKKYVVPHGGLFDLFVCPHYIFEMVDFVGMALISQTVFSWCMASFTIFYLTGRSMATKQWYRKKVEGFPEDRSVLIPGIF